MNRLEYNQHINSEGLHPRGPKQNRYIPGLGASVLYMICCLFHLLWTVVKISSQEANSPFSLSANIAHVYSIANHFSESESELLLVTRQNDNHSPGPGKLVPGPNKRSELSNRVFCTFSSRKERICKLPGDPQERESVNCK